MLSKQRSLSDHDLMLPSADRDWVDDRLHATRDPSGREREQEFPRLVLYHLFCIDILKYMNAVERQQNLVYFKDAGVLFERDHFKVCSVSADHHDLERGKIESSFP